MKTALLVVRTWAACDGLSRDSRANAMADIVAKCDEARQTPAEAAEKNG
jgi:hypothetical protein